MTPTMWLTLVACVGMATLAIPVVRARHELAAPLGALIADMLVWNLSWLAFQSSADRRWQWLAQSAASLVMVLGLDFVLTFVGRRRTLGVIRRAAYAFFGLASGTAASRLLLSGSELYVGDSVWRQLLVGGGAATAVLMGALLIGHYRDHRDRAERTHTRLLMIGFALWLVLAATDYVHGHMPVVPQMSAVGMLLSVAVMAIVMDRVRPGGPSRWWASYTVALFVVAVSGHVLAFKALPPGQAMLYARTVILVVVGLAAAREILVMAVQRRERLAELALVGRVTAQMAHDLRNPLAAIRGAAQVLERDALGGGAEGERETLMLAVITEQTARLSALVDDYRRVGRIEPRSVPVRLGDVVRRAARPVGIALDVRLTRAVRCMADPELVARALDNLMRNAAEAMPEGGRVVVSAETVGEGASRWVELSVTDDGPGMDARTCERAFEDFFTTKARGSGLGLAFVRRVAEVHGGGARIVSRVGRGTRVTLRLPAAAPPDLLFTEPAHSTA